jgi:uncharacterized protein (DUF488 family)
VLTVGHSTLVLSEFLARLAAHGAQAVVDVRRFPASRRHPHFNREALAVALVGQGIEYHWMPELGGRRAPQPDSRNSAWRNRSFRGYADYMETPAFHDGMERVLAMARERRIAIMCAEVLWWRCHRALISDYLLARGVPVAHILDETKSEPHRYTAPARVHGGVLSYAEERLI